MTKAERVTVRTKSGKEHTVLLSLEAFNDVLSRTMVDRRFLVETVNGMTILFHDGLESVEQDLYSAAVFASRTR